MKFNTKTLQFDSNRILSTKSFITTDTLLMNSQSCEYSFKMNNFNALEHMFDVKEGILYINKSGDTYNVVVKTAPGLYDVDVRGIDEDDDEVLEYIAHNNIPLPSFLVYLQFKISKGFIGYCKSHVEMYVLTHEWIDDVFPLTNTCGCSHISIEQEIERYDRHGYFDAYRSVCTDGLLEYSEYQSINDLFRSLPSDIMYVLTRHGNTDYFCESNGFIRRLFGDYDQGRYYNIQWDLLNYIFHKLSKGDTLKEHITHTYKVFWDIKHVEDEVRSERYPWLEDYINDYDDGDIEYI